MSRGRVDPQGEVNGFLTNRNPARRAGLKMIHVKHCRSGRLPSRAVGESAGLYRAGLATSRKAHLSTPVPATGRERPPVQETP
jgi:hypothetical protein